MSTQESGLPRGLLVLTVLVLVILVVIGALLVAGLAQRGKIYRGVTAAGVPLGGMTPDEAAERMAFELPATGGVITLRDPLDGRTWPLPAEELGLGLDAGTLATVALAAGRDGNVVSRLVAPLTLLLRGRDVLFYPPFDEARARSALEELAPAVDMEPEDAGFGIVDGVADMREPVTGRELDIEATLNNLYEIALLPDVSTVDLVLDTTAPLILDVGTVPQAYAQITSLPLQLNYQGKTLRTVDAETLRQWTSVTTTTSSDGESVPAIAIDETAIFAFLEPLAEEINRRPSNARLRMGDYGKVEVIEPALPGLALNVTGSADNLIRGAYTEQRVAELDVATDAPEVGNTAARALSGKARILGQSFTSVGGAPEGRMENFVAATRRLDGLSVAPGSTFSLQDALGDVSADSGFDMAQAWAGEPGSEQYGGGLEQVATTAFRAAAWAGLPIGQRDGPVHRMAWVEPPIGLDAAVGPDAVDLRFTNGTESVMFFAVSVDLARNALEWTIYGVSPHRTVELIGPSVTDLTPPQDAAVERPTDLLSSGSREQAIWAKSGASTSLQRVVTEGGSVLLTDTWNSSYAATPDVVLVGTGP